MTTTANTIRDIILAHTNPDIDTTITKPVNDPADARRHDTRADRVRRITIAHQVRAGIGHDAAPWLALAEDLGDLPADEDIQGEDADGFLRIVSEHLGRAVARVETLPKCDMADHIAVARHVEAMLSRAADLRFIAALTDAGLTCAVMDVSDTMTSAEVATFLGLATANAATDTMRRWGVTRLPYRSGDGQAVYDANVVREAAANRPGRGARTDLSRKTN